MWRVKIFRQSARAYLILGRFHISSLEWKGDQDVFHVETAIFGIRVRFIQPQLAGFDDLESGMHVAIQGIVKRTRQSVLVRNAVETGEY